MTTKPLIITVFLLTLTAGVFAQEGLSGKWIGVFSYPGAYGKSPRSFYFFIEMQQQDRSVWGIYNINDSAGSQNYACVNSFTGLLSKKTSAYFYLNPENLIANDQKQVTREACENIKQISFHYLVENGERYLVGRWYIASGFTTSADGAAGSVILQYTGNQVRRNLQDYFPRLDRILEHGKDTSNIPFVKPDNIKKATDNERIMIGKLSAFLASRQNTLLDR